MIIGKLKLVAIFILIFGSIYFLERARPMRVFDATGSKVNIISKAEKARQFEEAKEISSPDAFINTSGISIGELVGKKVILIDFWTYSCINCQRTQPYLNAWYKKYRDQGLEIIGIHTPEFEFEKKLENVQEAVRQAGIQYPVALDNDYSTWTAYKNRFWPRKYLLDIDGYIIYDHAGEGAYEETERKIQEALLERAMRLEMKDAIASDIAKPEDAVDVDFSRAQSPEVYFGSDRNDLYAGKNIPQGGPERDSLYLVGSWDIAREYAENTSAGAKITFRYRAKDVYLVAGADRPVSVRVLRDGKFLQTITIQSYKRYTAIEGEEYGEHTLELVAETPGLQVHTFTFGS